MHNIAQLIGRSNGSLFEHDLTDRVADLNVAVQNSRFLVIGGAGSIGQATVREIFSRRPRQIHVVDISENNLAELVRDIRSSLGYIQGDFRTFCLDAGGREFDAFYRVCGPYDYVLNFAALKHVRSERDPWTLMRLINVNVLLTDKTLRMAGASRAQKYFSVSTDKAANPVNMMGASKRIMEYFLTSRSCRPPVSTARFANVAFSDGSLPHGFLVRLRKKQPLAAPKDVRRYFMTPQESGELCLLSAILGADGEVFFPKLAGDANLLTFSDLAVRLLRSEGYEPVLCDSEDEARRRAGELIAQKKYPCYFFTSDTTGEKAVEEFFASSDVIDTSRFHGVGVLRLARAVEESRLDEFGAAIEGLQAAGAWTKEDVVRLFKDFVPEFLHQETHKYLDGRM